MNYRKLGRYGVRVSEISVGGWLTHSRTVDDVLTSEIINHAFDNGINFFDTSDAYNRGEAEKSLGKAVKKIRREDLFLATKCYFPFSDAPNDRGLSRKHIFESVHNSLKRMQVDYIDLQQFHRFDAETPLDETVHAISDLVRQGKILYWGVSEWSAAQIADVCHVAKDLNATLPVSNQPQYNMLHPNIEESVIPISEKFGLGQVVWSPLAQGILTGKYLPGAEPPAGSRGADKTSNQFMTSQLGDKGLLEKVQKLKKYAESQGASLPDFALAWCLRKSNVSSVITGATKSEQVDQNIKAAGLTFSPEIWEKAEKILSGDPST